MEKLRLVLNPCTVVPQVLSEDKHAELQAKLNQLGANKDVG